MARKTRGKLVLVLLGSFALAAVPAAIVSSFVWIRLARDETAALGAVLAEHAGPLIGLAVALAGAYGLLVWLVFEMYVALPLALAEGTRLVTHVNVSHRLEPQGGAEMEELARAINGLAEAHEALRREVEARIADAQKKVEDERDRLAALISEATQAVLVCNLEGRILLYNRRARQLLGQAPVASPEVARAGLVGLGRSVFAIMDRNLVAHALETIQARVEKRAPHPVASFVMATAGQLLRVHVAPVLRGARAAPDAEEPGDREAGERALTGFVLRIDDVTKPMEAGSRTEALLHSLTDSSRRALANIRAAVETLLAYPGMDAEKQARFLGAIHEEAAALSTTLDRAAPAGTSLRTEWLLEEMLGTDLVSVARSRIESTLGLSTVLDAVDPAVRLKVDSYSLVRAIVSIAVRLKHEGVRELRLALQPAGRRAHLDLAWSGADVANETLARWEEQPLEASGGPFPLTLKEVVEHHDGAVWYQASRPAATGFFRLVVPMAAEKAPLVLPAASPGRPEYYDFDLFHQAGQTPELDERKLTDLAYTVFDTETTGLSPSEGDEIISIGAVRIVNGRLLRGEVLEEFVDPRRPVSLATIRITGIDPALLEGKPPIQEVLPQFHRFCEDTVLVAHNAAFDMRFLQLKEAVAGVRFTHPVLDTLLLAAVIQPNLPSRGLEGIAERFGVPMLGRHTALGDAIMTGEIFLRMVPLLAERGLVTLRDAREASQRTLLARVQY